MHAVGRWNFILSLSANFPFYHTDSKNLENEMNVNLYDLFLM